MKLTVDQLKQRAIWKDPANQKLVADALGSVRPLGSLETGKPKRNQGAETQNPELERGTEGLGYRVTLIVCSRRRMDQHDNLRSACKPLVDAITGSLGFASDDNPRLEWRYEQITGPGKTGCIVKIETTNTKSHKRGTRKDD